VCAYYIRNQEAKRKLNIKWQGIKVDHVDNPKYLEKKLDHALTYNAYCEDMGKKIESRNNILHGEVLTTKY